MSKKKEAAVQPLPFPPTPAVSRTTVTLNETEAMLARMAFEEYNARVNIADRERAARLQSVLLAHGADKNVVFDEKDGKVTMTFDTAS